MSKINNRVHSFSNDILGHFDAVELASLIQNKSISQKEVIKATIQRAENINPSLRPIAYDNYDNALEKVEGKISGFFAGVPTFFKDLTHVKGIPVRFGSDAFANVTPSQKTDSIAEKILSMGFVNMGMSTMPEFGFTCSTEFPNQQNTLNPWNPTFSPGGSSGGAAVLVASGVVPIAHTADGGGSTRIPASCCGLVGLKPSRGRILLSNGFEKQIVDIAIDGVVTRSMRDTAHFYHEAELYYYNNNLPKIGLVTDPLNRNLNIGFLEEALHGDKLDASVQTAYKETLSLLEDLGHHLQAVQFPVSDEAKEDFKLLWAMQGYFVKRMGKLLFPKEYDPKKLTPFTRGLSKIYAKQFWKTPAMVKRIKQTYYSYHQFLKDQNIEILCTPTIGQLPPKFGHIDMSLDAGTIMSRMGILTPYTAYSNANGCPSISLPLQHDEENDLPIGIMFMGDHGQERLLFELGFQLEEAKPWNRIFD